MWQVMEAYMKPNVDRSKARFVWGRPDPELLRQFCRCGCGCVALSDGAARGLWAMHGCGPALCWLETWAIAVICHAPVTATAVPVCFAARSERFGWARDKVDQLLLPVLRAYDERQTQLTMDQFLSFNERFAKIRFVPHLGAVLHARLGWAYCYSVSHE